MLWWIILLIVSGASVRYNFKKSLNWEYDQGVTARSFVMDLSLFGVLASILGIVAQLF